MIKLIIIEGTWGVLAITMVSIISAPATTAIIIMAKIIMAKIIIAKIIMAKIIMATSLWPRPTYFIPASPRAQSSDAPATLYIVSGAWQIGNWQLGECSKPQNRFHHRCHQHQEQLQ